MRIAVFGTTGMVGSMVLKYLSLNKDLDIYSYCRNPDLIKFDFKAGNFPIEYFWQQSIDYDYIINCIGLTSHSSKKETNIIDRLNAFEANVLLPNHIYKWGCTKNCKFINISTNGFFPSTYLKTYREDDTPEPSNLYEYTKFFGELKEDNVYNLRCSIIGPEINNKKASLLSWFLSHKDYDFVRGYSNHEFQGITSLEFAKICERIITSRLKLNNIQHIVPLGVTTKYHLLNSFNRYYRRNISIIEYTDTRNVCKLLNTNYPDTNKLLFGGSIKTIDEMIEEMVEFKL